VSKLPDADWWWNMLDMHAEKGRADADAGVYDPPYPTDSDPQDEAENSAYRLGWGERRLELGEAFRWQ
jgi:hypothetical protein